MEFDPRIERYFDFDLNETERSEFLRELELNSELKTQFDLYTLLIEGIESEGRSELKEYIKSRVEEQSTTTQTNLWFYAAASVTVLLLGYFAIYKYLETGSFKESAEYITLKDEKSDRVKFWKNKKLGRRLLPNILFGDKTDSAEIKQHWTDSLLAVYRNTDEIINESPSESTIEYDDVSADDIAVNDPTQSNQKTLGKNPNTRVSAAESAAPIMVTDTLVNLDRRTISTSKLVAIHLRGNMELKGNNEVDALPQAPKVASKVSPATESAVKPKTIQNRFTIIQQEAYKEKPAIEIKESTIYLINLGSEYPLLYEIDGNYYLELGPNNIIAIKTNVSRIEKPKPITDKKIIEKIQPK